MRPVWLSDQMTWQTRVASFVSTVGGAGHSPVAPGTAGSLVAALIYIGLGQFSWPIQLMAILIVLGVSIWSANVTEEFTGLHDDGRIVIDEVVGTWVTLCGFAPSPGYIIAGFLLFRLLDIFKPFPANWIDRKWPGAYGVVFDDVVSGIYAQALLRVGSRLLGFG